MQLAFHLRNTESNSTTKTLTRIVKQQARSLEGRGLFPKRITVDVRLFLDALDIPSRDMIQITGGPSLVADYSALEEETWPTFQQAWQMGRLTVDLDRSFSKTSKVLTHLFDVLQPIDISVYAIADALRKIEARVQFDWFGLFETQAPQQAQIRIRLQSALVAFNDKISLVPPERKGDVLRWGT
jgi:hypothetical protein